MQILIYTINRLNKIMIYMKNYLIIKNKLDHELKSIKLSLMIMIVKDDQQNKRQMGKHQKVMRKKLQIKSRNQKNSLSSLSI